MKGGGGRGPKHTDLEVWDSEEGMEPISSGASETSIIKFQSLYIKKGSFSLSKAAFTVTHFMYHMPVSFI